jgi:hypothetical protein
LYRARAGRCAARGPRHAAPPLRSTRPRPARLTSGRQQSVQECRSCRARRGRLVGVHRRRRLRPTQLRQGRRQALRLQLRRTPTGGPDVSGWRDVVWGAHLGIGATGRVIEMAVAILITS